MNSLFEGLALFQAQPAASSSGSMISTVIMFGAVFLIFYFFIIRPQNKKQKAEQKMRDAVKKGDKVITIGGVHGVVSAVKDKTIVIKVDDSSKIEFSKSAIATVESRNDEIAEASSEKPADKKADETK